MKDCVSFECTHFAQADYNDPDERHALAYADIDGYPADEHAEGTVICRVWLMKEKDGIYPAYLVDWHWNAYRMNEEVKGLINEAKKELKDYLKTLKDAILAKVYEKYKLKCMLANGFTLDILLEKLQAIMDAGTADSITNALKVFEYDMQTANVHQLVWESKDVFSVMEWEDDEYMRDILSMEDYAIWKYKI